MVDVSEALQARLDACDEQYALHFAGQPRLTADLEMLAALQSEATAVAEQARAYAAAALAELADQRAAALAHEVAAIDAAQQAAGAAACERAHYQRQAALAMHRYGRHFAGQPRHSRDLGLLREIMSELAALQERLGPHAAAAALASSHAALAAEAAAILAARGAGTPAQQAAAWGAAANTLLQTYADLCIGRRTLACRPQLWERLVAELTACEHAMQALAAAGLDIPHHAHALRQLGAQKAQWHEELAAVRTAHAAATPEARLTALDAELDDILGTLNAATPPTRAPLAVLCDRLHELLPQLAAHPHGAAQAVVARDALGLLCSRVDAAAA